MKNILIFGGTFDPVHNGHALFLQSAQALCHPCLTLLVPCNIPVHKQGAKATDEMRVRMCEALCKTASNTIVYKAELERGGKSYTIDTILQIMQEYKGARLYMCVGGDMLLYFRQWKDWEKLIKLVTLVVQNREQDSEQVYSEAAFLSELGANILFTQAQPIVVSSTQLRERLICGDSISGLVPDNVNEIITQNNLYRR